MPTSELDPWRPTTGILKCLRLSEELLSLSTEQPLSLDRCHRGDFFVIYPPQYQFLAVYGCVDLPHACLSECRPLLTLCSDIPESSLVLLWIILNCVPCPFSHPLDPRAVAAQYTQRSKKYSISPFSRNRDQPQDRCHDGDPMCRTSGR